MHRISSAKASHVGRRPQRRTFVAPQAAIRRTASYGAADLERDFVGAARLRMGIQKTQNPENMDDFVSKIKAAWRIFFPERERELTPKDEGKKRLRMILVADRCGMSTESLEGMRLSIVKAMESYVEVAEEEAVEVNLSLDPDLGTIYSVAVPVKRVRPTVRPLEEDAMLAGGRVRWDPNDPDSDPSDQFPFGA